MPGIKRKGSQVPIIDKPPKLKKQSTSTTIENAKGKAEKKKKNVVADSLDSPPKLEKMAVIEAPRKLASPVKKSPEKKYKMPRFPTLKPTKPLTDDSDFSFSVPSFYSKSSKSTNFTKLKKASTIELSEEEPKFNDVKEAPLTTEATEILPPTLEIEVDPNCTRASEIEKKMQKLPSGSIVGKITNLEFDDLILPIVASDVLYEFSDESPTKITTGSLQPRASAFEVAEYLTSLDTPDTSEKTEKSLNTIEEEPVEFDFFDTDQETDESANKPINEDGDENSKSESKPESNTNGSSSPVKTPRKVPGGLREIVFSFDTTGSMYNYMEEAGERIRDLVNRLQTEMPGIRLAFMAHGDYYDLSHDRYLIKWIDFGASIEEVVKFFENLSITHGGDDDECYELVLRKTRESLSWTPGSQRSLVVIGDSDPHEPGYKYEQFVNDVDWKLETALLKEMGVRIYGLQVGYRSDFYKQISQMTGGAHLRIDNVIFTYETLMSICLREGSLKLLKSYENEVRKAKKNSEEGGVLDLELERLFSSLKSVEDNKSTKTMLKEQKQALKEEKKVKRALELEAKSEKRSAENEDGGSPAKKPKIDNMSPHKASNKLKNSPSAKILSKAKKKIIEKTLAKTSPVNKRIKIKKDAEKTLNKKDASKRKDLKSNSKVKKVEDGNATPTKTSLKTAKKVVKTDGVKNAKKTRTNENKKHGQPGKSANKTQTNENKKSRQPGKSAKETPRGGAKKPGQSSKKDNVTPKQEKKTKNKDAKESEKVKEVKKVTAKAVKPKGKQEGKAKPVQSPKTPKTSPAAKKSPGKITKTKVPLKVSSKKADLIKKSVKDAQKTEKKVTKKPEKSQVTKKVEKPKPAVKNKSESESKQTPKKTTQKAQKTPPKTPKPSPKVSKSVKKQPREAAPVTKFVMGPLSVFSWDNWLPLITHTKPDVKTKDWKKKPSICPGFCNDKVYKSETPQAVYEIAVSPPDSTKRYPVYYAIDALWSCFSSARVKKEVERVIKAKGSLSVRKGSLGKPNDAAFQKAVDFMKVNFDYAWDGRGEDVKKDGFIIAKAI